MTDLTAPLAELRAAYRAYQNAKRDKKDEIQEKYRTRMEDETRAAVQAEKYAFAKLLKDRKEFYGLQVGDIQDHVIRTRNWKVWEDIRDFAEIEPEQVVRDNAKQARKLANLPYRWDPEARTITWLKGPKGEPLREEVVFGDLDPNERSGYNAVVRSHNNGKVIVDAYGTSLSKFLDIHVVPVMREVL